MKKLLTLLGAVGLTATLGTNVVACGKEKETPETPLETAAKNYLITEEFLGFKDVIVENNTKSEISEMAKKIVELLKSKTELMFDFEGKTATIDVTTLKAVDEKIGFDYTYEEVKSSMTINWKTATEINLVDVSKLNGTDVMKSEDEIKAKEFSIKKELGLQSVYEEEITFASDKIDSSKTDQEVEGKITLKGEKFISTKSEYTLKINLHNSITIINALAAQTWKSNTFVNGVTTYDGVVYGIVPSSLHDAIALHTGDDLTGNYIFIKTSEGEALTDEKVNKDTGEINGHDEPFHVTKWGLWDAQNNKEITDFNEVDYRWSINAINNYINILVNGVRNTGSEGTPAYRSYMDSLRGASDWKSYIKTSAYKSFFYNGDSGGTQDFISIKTAIDEINARNGKSFIRYDASKGFNADDLAEGGIKKVMEDADSKTTLADAEAIGKVGDAFNWGRNISAAHNFADYFNKYVHEGEKVSPDGNGKIVVKNKQFSVSFGSSNYSFTIQGIDPTIQNDKEIAYYGLKDQGLVFKLENNVTSEISYVEMTMEQLFKYNEEHKDVKGMVLKDYK